MKQAELWEDHQKKISCPPGETVILSDGTEYENRLNHYAMTYTGWAGNRPTKNMGLDYYDR